MPEPQNSAQETPAHPLLEQLAALEHERWSHWMRYLFLQCLHDVDGKATIPASLVERWQRQAHTSYADLTEREKESDRAEVHKTLAIVHPYYSTGFTERGLATLRKLASPEEASLARIRGLLEHPVRTEDPECCLFQIGEIVQEGIGDRVGIPPDDDDAEETP